MRNIAAVVLVCALASFAGAEEWEGVWQVEGGGTRTVSRAGGKYELALDVGERVVPLSGTASGSTLKLEGKIRNTKGMTHVIGEEEVDRRERKVTLEAIAVETTATVTIRVDSETSKETWFRVRPEEADKCPEDREGLELIEVVGRKGNRTGTIDLKSTDGISLRVRVNGSAKEVFLRVEVGRSHPYASFYADARIGRVVHERQLGRLGAGEHWFQWDGRDCSPARRYLLPGSYDVRISEVRIGDETSGLPTPRVIERTSGRCVRTLSVAPPSLRMIAGAWDVYDTSGRVRDDARMQSELGSHLNGVRPTLGSAPPPPGYQFVSGESADSAFAFEDALRTSAVVFLETHGTPSSSVRFEAPSGVKPAFRVGMKQTPSRPREDVTVDRVGDFDLRDLRVAMIGACNSAGMAQALKRGGCDLVIGFDATVYIVDLQDFMKTFTILLWMGAPIEKAARDSAYLTLFDEDLYCEDEARTWEDVRARYEHEKKNPRPKALGTAIYTDRGKDIPESESFWPPRYGNSAN